MCTKDNYLGVPRDWMWAWAPRSAAHPSVSCHPLYPNCNCLKGDAKHRISTYPPTAFGCRYYHSPLAHSVWLAWSPAASRFRRKILGNRFRI